MARTKEATELDRQIGKRLRLLRVARGKTQEWLAEQLRLTFQQVQKYEKGINRISGSCMQDIASALGVTPAYFFGDAAAKRDTDVLAEAETIGLLQDHGALALIRAYHAMPAGQRMALRNLAVPLQIKRSLVRRCLVRWRNSDNRSRQRRRIALYRRFLVN
jgi:transcriptional regulator with XRE-family HTH domain